MKKIPVYLSMVFFVCAASAQEVKTDIGSKDTIQKLEISGDLNLDMPDLKLNEQVKNDPFNALKPDGFSSYQIYSNDAVNYSLYGKYNMLPGLSSTGIAGGTISMNINESFMIHMGAYGMKYDFNFASRPYYDAVIHLNASYNILPWLIVGAYGQYAGFSRYNVKHGSILPSPMVPYSGYGVNATTMFNEVFGIQGSVGREYNPFNRQWQPVYGIAPVINLNKLFR